MRLLIVSKTGFGLGIASHLSSEGHLVNILIDRDDCSRIGTGIVSLTGNGRPDITIFDNSQFGKNADELRQSGERVFGASHWAQTLQDDPEYRKAVIRATWGTLEPITKGVDAYVSCWFNGNDYIATYLSVVYHRMTPGGTSPDVGFTGCVSNFWEPTSKVRDAFLTPLVKVLRRVNHRGCFHIRSTINGDMFSISDIAASFEHPLSLLLFENSKNSVPDILLKLFDEGSSSLTPLNQWVCSVMLSVPPFPYTVHSLPTALTGVIPANLKHLWLSDAMRENGRWMTTGSHGKVGYVTSRGTTISESCRRAYRTIRNLQIQDLQYRNDVGRDIGPLLVSLRNNGWIK
jgi:hypothetical protein